MTWPQSTLDSFAFPGKGHSKDPPRAMMAWAIAGRFMDQPHRETPWGGGTANHKLQRLAGWLVHTRCAPEYVDFAMEFLAGWLFQGEQYGEQHSSTYDGHHGGALVTIASAAKIAGKEALYDLAMRLLATWCSSRWLCTCPDNAHSSVAGRSYIAGRRCGDATGMLQQRDLIVRLAAHKPIPGGWRWPIVQDVQMEPHAARIMVERANLPAVRLDAPMPRLEDALHVEVYEHGHRAWTPLSTMKPGRGGTILWGVQVDYRTGRKDSVSWADTGKTYKEARQMKGGPMPGPLPGRNLGAVVRSVVIGRGQSSPTPPEPPTPPADPPPPPAGDFDPALIPDGGQHATMAFHEGPYKGGVAIINVQRGALRKGDAKYVRWHRRPG